MMIQSLMIERGIDFSGIMVPSWHYGELFIMFKSRLKFKIWYHGTSKNC